MTDAQAVPGAANSALSATNSAPGATKESAPGATKVLYGLWNYPQLSETYVETEIQYALSQGIDVRVWAGVNRKGLESEVPVYRGTLKSAVADFKPNVFHIHYLAAAPGFLSELGWALGIPAVTIRGHSFDWSPVMASHLSGDPRIKRLWVFPHFAAQVPFDPKIVGLPVACSSAFYGPGSQAAGPQASRFGGEKESRFGGKRKNRRLVFRASAGRPDKGLDDFFEAARLCPGFEFVLAVAEAGGPGGGPELIQKLTQQAQASAGRVRLVTDVSQSTVVALTHQAGIYLDTSDPAGHPFGMPISIAESLVTGSYVLARTRPGAAAFIGDAGRLYDTAEQAADIINQTAAWNDAGWQEVCDRAQARGASFLDVNVLKPVVEFWKSLS